MICLLWCVGGGGIFKLFMGELCIYFYLVCVIVNKVDSMLFLCLIDVGLIFFSCLFC